MKSYCFALAALVAVGFSGAAFAEDGTWSTTTGTAPKVMSDSDMDKVTAGFFAGGGGGGGVNFIRAGHNAGLCAGGGGGGFTGGPGSGSGGLHTC
jgi:hypothetical protein